jgi:hypothetical protein
MEIERYKRKYHITGDAKGWAMTRFFPTKWKAEIALAVFNAGGTFRDYCVKMNEALDKRPLQVPTKALAEIEKAYEEIRKLNWSEEDIVDFAKIADAVTTTRSRDFFGPRIHDTWGAKKGGRVHIDLGAAGIHLMLDRRDARRFIEFLKERHKTTD